MTDTTTTYTYSGETSDPSLIGKPYVPDTDTSLPWLKGNTSPQGDQGLPWQNQALPWQSVVPPSSANQPRAAIFINGITATDAVISFDVKNNNYFAADSFDVDLALGALPPSLNAAFWSNTQARIEIQAGFPGNMVSLITGDMDTMDIDIKNGTVKATGRDLTAGLIDTKSEEKYQNLTASQIVQKIAGLNGLHSDVVPTSTPAGRYYEIDHSRLTTNVSQWQLLNYLAEEEGFDIYVTGTTLHFTPSAPGGQSGLVLTYQPATAGSVQSGDFIDIQMRRSLTLAKDVVVKVVSWNAKQEKAFTATAKRQGSSQNPYNGNGQVYTFKKPGLTPDQAQAFANAKLKEITLHERVVDVTIPGETALQPRQLVTLTGTGTSFDQDYYIDEITRALSWDQGFTTAVRMKNHTAESQASL